MNAIAPARQSLYLRRPSLPNYRNGRMGILALAYLATIFFLAGRPDFSISAAAAFDKSADIIRDSVSSGDLVRQVVFISFGFMGVVGYWLNRRTQFRLTGRAYKCAIFFGIWTCISIAWSDDPALTLRRLSVSGMLLIGTLWICRKYNINEIPRFTIFATAAYLVIGFVTELFLGTFRPLSGSYRFAGSMHPNQQGINCAILLLSLTAVAVSQRRWSILRLTGAVIALAFLILTKSRTSVAAAVVAVVVFECLNSRRKLRAFMVAFLIGISVTFALSVFTSPMQQMNSLILMGRERSDAGVLTGRNLIWEDALPFYLERPLVGYGYETFWSPSRTQAMSDKLGPGGVPEGHSTYFDLLLDLGPIGLILGMACIGFGIAQSISRMKEDPGPGNSFCLMMFIFFAVHELTESSLMYQGLSEFIFLWCLFAVGWKRVMRTPNQSLR